MNGDGWVGTVLRVLVPSFLLQAAAAPFGYWLPWYATCALLTLALFSREKSRSRRERRQALILRENASIELEEARREDNERITDLEFEVRRLRDEIDRLRRQADGLPTGDDDWSEP